MATKYLAARVLPDARFQILNGAVVVDDDRIAWVGIADESPEADETVDLGDVTLTPGLINAHSHLDLSHLQGEIPFDCEFAQWIEQIVGRRNEPGIGAAARSMIRGAIERGTTAFGDVVARKTYEEIVSALADTGVRARLFIELVGFKPELADGVFADAWEAAEMRPLPDHVDTGFSPHAPYSCSRELIARAVAVADGHGKPLAVHYAETLEELAFLRHGIGPLRELTKKFKADDENHEPYGGMLAFLEQLDLKHANLLLIHGNYLRPRDVPAGAFVVYCPTAHYFFAHPEHPALEMVEDGVRVALGSDSAASGDTVDVLSETQFLALHRMDFDEHTIFQMATEWGAQALGLEAGKLEAGRLADFAAFTPNAGHEILGLADAQCVFTVVGGRVQFDAR